MGVSVLRVAACAGVLVCGLILGDSAAGPAVAEPGDTGNAQNGGESSHGETGDGESSDGVNNLGEDANIAGVEGEAGASPNLNTFSKAPEPAPESASDDTPRADPGGPEGSGTGMNVESSAAPAAGGGSDLDNATVAGRRAAVPTKTTGFVSCSRQYPLLELRRRGGGDWWNAKRIIQRLEQAIRPPPPEPEPVPGPAFRGGAPEPEPVLDASGGVAGGGNDYQATGFGAAPVLSAPIVVAVPVPPAAARFPSVLPAATPAPGVGAAAARGADAAPGFSGQGSQAVGPREQASAGTVKAMPGPPPRQGYTDHLRGTGLPQLAGAALPGVAGILVMTLGGVVVGHRQAEAGRMSRAGGAARYLP